MSDLFSSSSFEDAFKSFLAQRVSLLPKGRFLVDTACMDMKTREIYGYLIAYLEYRNLRGKKKSSLERFKKPLVIMGQSKWYRGVLDDLGLFIGLEEGQGIDLLK
jgi:hypothetical protein